VFFWDFLRLKVEPKFKKSLPDFLYTWVFQVGNQKHRMMLFLKKYFDNLACSQNLAKPSSYIG
jgi:hypothetical protein